MKTLIALTALVVFTTGSALAKLPALSEEAKTKAAEDAAKAAWSDKVASYKLCQSMDRVAATYFAQQQAAGKAVQPAVDTPACTDPGAFSYTPAASKPLEAAGAHSPPQTAATPPSTNQPAAAATGTPLSAGSKP